MRPIYIYIHIACINHYEDILGRFIAQIYESGLYDSVTEIRYCILGRDDSLTVNDPKIKIRNNSEDITLYETFTLNCIHEDSKIENFDILYLHTKGVTKPGNTHVEDWVEYMVYFLVYQFKECLTFLKVYDTVGVNLQDPDFAKCHYGGNFWWSKSEYIRTLSPCIHDNYFSAEFWLCESKKGKYIGLWNSKSCHYTDAYPSYIYRDRGIYPYSI